MKKIKNVKNVKKIKRTTRLKRQRNPLKLSKKQTRKVKSQRRKPNAKRVRNAKRNATRPLSPTRFSQKVIVHKSIPDIKEWKETIMNMELSKA